MSSRTKVMMGLGIVVLLVVRGVFGGGWFVNDLVPNLATEIAGIMATVLLVDRAIAHRREVDRRRRAGIAATGFPVLLRTTMPTRTASCKASAPDHKGMTRTAANAC